LGRDRLRKGLEVLLFRSSAPAFVLPEAVEVEGMGVDSLHATWMGASAQEKLLEVASDAGLSTVAPKPGQSVITLSPGSVATAGALRRFRKACAGRTTDACGQLSAPLQQFGDMKALGEPARMVFLAGGGAWSAERQEQAERIEVEAPHRPWTLPATDPETGKPAVIPMADAVVVNMAHWSGVLWANLLSLPPGLWGLLLGKSPIRSVFSAARGLARARSLHPDVLAQAASVVGRRAKVHPTAVVEASYIAPGAEVGPGAIVRQSIVGPGSVIEPQAMLIASVMGARARVRRRGWIKYSVLMDDAVHGGVAQLAVLGPGATTKGLSALMDQRLGGPVRVKRAGGLHPVPLGFLGVGVGARTVVGSGVWVAAGRTLPPDKWVVRSSSTVLARPDVPNTAVDVLDAPPDQLGAASAL
jgi:hypothetical protein